MTRPAKQTLAAGTAPHHLTAHAVPAAAIDPFDPLRKRRDELVTELLDAQGATPARCLAEIDQALAAADSALALLAFEVRRQRDQAAQRVAQREREAADKRKAAATAHAARLLKAHARKQAQDALATEAEKLIAKIESNP